MQLNNLRALYLKLIDSITNEFIIVLTPQADDYSGIARHLHVFVHERIDSMQILIRHSCLWDADMLLRSISEACVKLAYISCFNNENNENNENKKVKEFWSDLAEINMLKESKQVSAIVETIQLDVKELTDLILSKDIEEELRGKWTKKKRQKIEQPWSFNEMIKVISKEYNHKEILCLNRSFTKSSHLLHADETALGVIADRRQRDIEDKEYQCFLHAKRLYSDSLTLYFWILELTLNVYGVAVSNELLNLKEEYTNIENDFV